MSRILHIPNTLPVSRWPYPRRINAAHEQVSAESAAWLRSFHAFSAEKQVAFDKCNFGLLASLTYPDVDEDHLRAACDIMNVFFLFDEQTDTVNAARVRELGDIVIDAVRNPERPRPEGEPVVGEITRQFWVHACVNSTASGRARFEDAWARYVGAVVGQAEDRDAGRLRTTEEYLELRRFTIGTRPCYALAMLKVDLPLEVSELPILRNLSDYITDIVFLDNVWHQLSATLALLTYRPQDLVSYPKEFAVGDLMHNIITLVMNEKHLDLDAAVAWLAAEHAKRVDGFLALLPEASSLSFDSNQVNQALSCYLDHVINWARGCGCWYFECGRYFGEDGLKVATEGIVELTALKNRDA
ncbi:hypothetical protein VTO73DRAFT_11876 [Trametes versicolor]